MTKENLYIECCEANRVCLSQKIWGLQWRHLLREKNIPGRIEVCEDGKWFVVIATKCCIRKPTRIAFSKCL